MSIFVEIFADNVAKGFQCLVFDVGLSSINKTQIGCRFIASFELNKIETSKKKGQK
jgi:hypothetical protein